MADPPLNGGAALVHLYSNPTHETLHDDPPDCLLRLYTGHHGTREDPREGYIYGTVMAITDADTFTLLTPAKEQGRIRLAEIDMPERGQPFGKWAKERLSELIFQKDVAVIFVDVDRYDRIVGRVCVGDLDVNAELVRLGVAWVYDKYATDESLYVLQQEAVNEGRGLWKIFHSSWPDPAWVRST